MIPPSPWADSIWVFYQSNSYAIDPSQTSNAMFSTEQIINAQDTLFDTLTVGALPQINDLCFWLSYSILWHDPNSSLDTLLRPLIEANKVFMPDTTAPINSLAIYGEYLMKTDTIILTIDGIINLSASQDSLVAVQCSYYPQFNALTKDTTLSVETLLNGGDQYKLTLDSIGYLPLEQADMYCRWFIIGKNNIKGAFKETLFTVGLPRPVYTGTLTVDSTHMGNTILASWDYHTQSVDNIRIWWNTLPVPLVHDIQLSEDQAHYVTSLTANIDTIKGFTNGTIYYFGLQILKDNLWSEITSLSSVQGKTAMWDKKKFPIQYRLIPPGFMIRQTAWSFSGMWIFKIFLQIK